MSHQLAFWRTTKRQNPDGVYAKVLAGRVVGGLEPVNPDDVETRLR